MKAQATHRQINAVCPRGHRLPAAYARAGEEVTQTCSRCRASVTSAVERDANGHLTVIRRRVKEVS